MGECRVEKCNPFGVVGSVNKNICWEGAPGPIMQWSEDGIVQYVLMAMKVPQLSWKQFHAILKL